MSELGAGIHNVPAEVYHADALRDDVTLSQSIAKLLIDKTPAHAREAHPGLNPAYEPDNDTKFDLGKSAHALLLEGKRNCVVIDAPNYRTKKAREKRDAAHEAGETPILASRWADVEAMVGAAHAQLDAMPECRGMFREGRGLSERTALWQEGGVWCRALLDRLDPGHYRIIDYKTVDKGSAEPDAWARNNLWNGRDLQPAWYCRAVRALLGWKHPEFLYVIQEAYPPYALSVVSMSPAAMVIAESRIDAALEIWRQCLERNTWPGYPAAICYVDPPGWYAQRWDERFERDKQIRAQGIDLVDSMIAWQSPKETP